MKELCIPLTSFAHDAIDAHEGVPIPIESGLARDLELAGLVRIKRAASMNETAAELGKKIDNAIEMGDKLAEAAAGGGAAKMPDDGAGPPSSVSPAASVSVTPTTPTSPRSAPGAKKKRKAGAS